MRRPYVALPVMVLLLQNACMVGPRYVKPSAATAPAFKEAAEAREGTGWKIATPDDSVIRSKWWESYGDARLDQLEDQIDSSNQTLKVAEARLQDARAAVRFAGSALTPTLTASPSFSAVRTSANAPYFPSSLANNGDHEYSLPLELSYEVDLWGRVRRTIAASKRDFQATAADLETARLSLHAELALDYFELRSADAQRQLLDATVKAYGQALVLTENRFSGGVAPRTDVAQARTQLDTARVLYSDIAVQRAQYEHAIAILIGQPPASFSLDETPLNRAPPDLPSVPVAVPTQLLERRPDVAAAERRMASANERIGIAKAAYFPTLNLLGVAGWDSASSASWFNWPSRFWAAGPTLSQLLFDGGRRRATTESAIAEYDASVATYRQTVLQSFQQVEDNLAALRVLETDSGQQHEATASAEETLRLFQNRYAGGVDTYLQVVTSQTAALANERNDIDLMKRRLEASVLLVKALGGGWETSELPRP